MLEVNHLYLQQLQPGLLQLQINLSLSFQKFEVALAGLDTLQLAGLVM